MSTEISRQLNVFNAIAVIVSLLGVVNIAGLALGLLIGWAWVMGLGGLLPGVSSHLPTGTVAAVAAVLLGTRVAILPARLDVLAALKYE